MDEKSNSDRASVISRRNYLKSASALGISAVGIQSVHAEGDSTELIVTRSSEGPAETRVVPTEWYTQTQKAKQKAEELENQLLNQPGVVSIGIGIGNSTIGGLKEKVIQVGLEGESTVASIPEHVGGIDVQVKANVSTEYQCYEGPYDTLRGGIALDSDYGSGSACCRVYRNGTPYLLTARHVFTDDGSRCGNTGNGYAYQGINYIGSEKDSKPHHDSLWINVTNDDVTLSDQIIDESAYVEGWVTQAGLDTYSSDDTTLHKRGISTCKETYTVDSYDNTLNIDCGEHTEVVYYNGNSDAGDSGGIIYFISDEGKAYVSGLLSGEVTVDCGWYCSDTYTFGSAAYAMNSQYDLNFD